VTAPAPREAAIAAARASYGRLIAYLSARSHDIAAAEDALGEAFHAALIAWPRDGVPLSPEAWLLTAARRRLHDGWRHAQVHEAVVEQWRLLNDGIAPEEASAAFPDERLALMFVCAHPAIDAAARAPLMLQTVLGLDAARMAGAFLVSPAALGQRLVRAKAKIRAAGIPFEIPPAERWLERLGDVLEAIYAAYGTGWDDVAGTDPKRGDLAVEALTLAATVVQLLPDEPEPLGLLALLAFCQARAAARRDEAGEYVPLAQQDARRWNSELLATAESALLRAARMQRVGAFQLEAAIQSAHTQKGLGAPVSPQAIVQLYDALVALQPTLGARVSRACALAPAAGVAAALEALFAIGEREVAGYQPYWAARAHLLRLAGREDEARQARQRAIGLTADPALRLFLSRQGS